MSNCKAFGLLQTRDHAIGQTPHNVLAPRSQEDLQRCAAFSTKERTTPAKPQSDARRVPGRRRQSGRSPPDDVELRRRRTEIGRAGSPYFCAECNTAALNAAARNTANLNAAALGAAVLIDCRSQHNHQKAPRICRHSKQSHNPDAQSDDKRAKDWNRHLPECGLLTNAGLIERRPTPTAARNPATAGRNPAAATGAISVTRRSRLV